MRGGKCLDTVAFHPYTMPYPEMGLGSLDIIDGEQQSRTPADLGFKTWSEMLSFLRQMFSPFNPLLEYWADECNARIKWHSMDLAMNFSSPVAVGDYVYGLGPDRNIFCVEARTGKPMWSKSGYTPSEPEDSHAALLARGKNLLLLPDTGELVLFSAGPTRFEELGRVQVCGSNWCNPAYADGKLFVRDARELVCVELLP